MGVRVGIVTVVAVALLSGCSSRTVDAPPDELISTGWRQFNLGEFALATDAFEAAVANLERSDTNYYHALYGLATAWNLRTPVGDQDKALAKELYGQIIAEAPDGEPAPWSALALARMAHLVPVGRDPDYALVREAYRRTVIERFPDHPAADEATIYLYSTYTATLDPGDAKIARQGLEQFIAESPESGFLSAAHNLAALSCLTMGAHDEQLSHMIAALNTLERDPRNPFYDVAWRYWLLAATAEFEVGEFEVARRFYRKLLDEYPQDIRGYGAQQALQRMDDMEAQIRAELREESP